jgi:hypothetical protein
MTYDIVAASTAPTGGAALDQVVGLSVAAAVITAVLGVLAWQHRTHRSDWLERVGDRLGARMRQPGWVALPVAITGVSLVVALLGYMWDVALHAGRGRDEGPLANPAHYLILYGLFAIFLAGMVAVVYSRRGERPGPAAVRITRHWFAPVSGLYIAGCGLYALVGFPLDDVWHRLFGQDVTLWGPTHLMLIGGAGLATAGIVLLVREGELSGQSEPMPPVVRYVLLSVAFGALLIGLSVFQGEFDFGVAQFRLVFAPFLVVIAAGISLVAARVYVGPGAAVVATLFFLAMRGVVTLVVGELTDQAHHVFPLYLGMALVVELLALTALARRPLVLGAVAGLGIGTVGLAVELIWTNRVFAFDWTRGMWAEGLAMAVPTAVGAGLCGALFALGLQGRLPRRAVSGTVVAGFLAVVSLGVANGLWATVPDDAQVRLTTTDAGTASEPAVLVRAELPDGLVDDDPTWIQVTAWQGGGEGVVTDVLEQVGADTWESTKPVPVGGTWKTLLRVQDGRMLTAAPIFMPADAAIDAEEIPVEASTTRALGPEIDLLQRERTSDHPAWTWAAANAVVLVCSLAMVAGICWSVARVASRVEGSAARADERVDA